jgi:sialate O-acetylesterase
VSGFEQAYWNGKKVSETPYSKYPGAGYVRYFAIPLERVRVGTNTLAVRIYAPTVPPGIVAARERFWAGPLSLVGPWLAKAEYELPPLSPRVLATVPAAPARPPSMAAGGIFNGVISPIIPYGIDGVVWYQGESNAGRAYDYRVAFPLLIDDWRRKWRQPRLPFYFCQLASFGPKKPLPGESEWAELRESQSTALQLPGTGQAVLIDLGESGDVHFRNKRAVGERLARIALAKQYGEKLVFSGPVYESMKVEGATIRVTFSHAEGGLAARALAATYDVVSKLGQTAPLVRNSPESELEGFAICGADRHWRWAEARIEGGTVVVWSSRVSYPLAVRYAWADNPTCNLENGAGLPASPLRSDDFRAITARNHFGPGQ